MLKRQFRGDRWVNKRKRPTKAFLPEWAAVLVFQKSQSSSSVCSALPMT